MAAARLLTLPASLWEYDEVLFVRGVERFEPLAYRPHPPGYPLLIGLGKIAAAIVGDPFRGLVAVSVVLSLIGYLAAVDAFAAAWSERSHGDSRAESDGLVAAVAGALLFSLSPPMLVYGPLALSDAPAIGFVALALAAALRWLRRPIAIVPAIVCGVAAAAAVGCRPQLALAVVPMLLATIVLALRRSRGVEESREPAGATAPRTANAIRASGGAVVGFAALATAWVVPLVMASGGPNQFAKLLRGQAGLVAANDASLSRSRISATELAARFVVDPWGPRWTAVVVLALAAAGVTLVVRRRRGAALPLLVFSAVDLAFALAVMNPPDAARYAIPSMLAVAFLAGGGCASLRALLWGRIVSPVVLAVLLLGFTIFTAPLLRQRTTTPSPPVQAAEWARAHLPEGTLVLYERELESYALELLPQWKRVPADGSVPCATRRPVFLLAEGESSAPGAVTFRWADGPAWRSLTRQRLGVVSWTPVWGSQLFEPLAGVHAAEPSSRAWLTRGPRVDAWRWLADRASLRVCPDGAMAVELRLRLPMLAPHPAVDVELSVAGTRQRPVHIARGESTTVRLPLSAARRVRIDLTTQPSFVPAESGLTPGDRRRLAVQLVGLQLVDAW